MSDFKDTFCQNRWTYPVFSLARGDFRFCCHSLPRQISEEELQAKGKESFLNSDYEKARRLEMLTGVKHDTCASCWRREERGLSSPRYYDPDFIQKQGHQPRYHLVIGVKLRKKLPTIRAG